MQDTYDPYSFILSEIQAYDAGQRDWEPGLRAHYLSELRADEAEELAWGRRHLTVEYGPGADPTIEQYLFDLVGGFIQNLPDANWSRLSGLPGRHVTVTVGGPSTNALVDLMSNILCTNNPGWWRVLDTAVVVPGR